MNVDCITLIGYRATGKTSVGRLLAQRLQWPFVDTDAEIKRAAGRSIAAIFSGQGEEAFRQMEIEAIDANVSQRPSVLSLGGGAVTRNTNRIAIESTYRVWLTASAETIHARLSADRVTAEQRPDLTPQGGLSEVREVLAARTSLYQACADLVIDTDALTPEQVVEQIVQAIKATNNE